MKMTNKQIFMEKHNYNIFHGETFKNKLIDIKFQAFLMKKLERTINYFNIAYLGYSLFLIIEILVKKSEYLNNGIFHAIFWPSLILIFLLILFYLTFTFKNNIRFRQLLFLGFFIIINLNLHIDIMKITKNEDTIYKGDKIISTNFFKAAIEFLGCFCYFLRNPVIPIIFSYLHRAIFLAVYASRYVEVEFSDILFQEISLFFMAFFTFIIKQAMFFGFLDIFITQETLLGTNLYYSGFISEFNSSILTIKKNFFLDYNRQFVRDFKKHTSLFEADIKEIKKQNEMFSEEIVNNSNIYNKLDKNIIVNTRNKISNNNINNGNGMVYQAVSTENNINTLSNNNSKHTNKQLTVNKRLNGNVNELNNELNDYENDINSNKRLNNGKLETHGHNKNKDNEEEIKITNSVYATTEELLKPKNILNNLNKKQFHSSKPSLVSNVTNELNKLIINSNNNENCNLIIDDDSTITQNYLNTQLNCFLNSFSTTTTDTKNLAELINFKDIEQALMKNSIYSSSEVLQNLISDNEFNRINTFVKLGEFCFLCQGEENEEEVKQRYFEISIRKFFIYEHLISLDIVFTDITDLKDTEAKKIEFQIKGKMFSKIAHEFKTPLITITSQLDLLNEKILNNNCNEMTNLDINSSEYITRHENQEEIIEIASSIKHLAHYTNFLILDIIQYSNTNNKGKIANKDGDCSDNTIKKEIVENFKSDIVLFNFLVLNALLSYSTGNKKNIESKLIYDDELDNYQLYTNKIKFNQIILNIISNSVKFTKAGTILITCYLNRNKERFTKEEISVQTMHKDFEKGYSEDFSINEVNFSNYEQDNNSNISVNINSSNNRCFELATIKIIDTGLGMSRKLIESLRIGNPSLVSLRAYNNSMGSGLGVGISKQICNSLNYDLKVSSEEGMGTTFTLRFLVKDKSLGFYRTNSFSKETQSKTTTPYSKYQYSDSKNKSFKYSRILAQQSKQSGNQSFNHSHAKIDLDSILEEKEGMSSSHITKYKTHNLINEKCHSAFISLNKNLNKMETINNNIILNNCQSEVINIKADSKSIKNLLECSSCSNDKTIAITNYPNYSNLHLPSKFKEINNNQSNTFKENKFNDDNFNVTQSTNNNNLEYFNYFDSNSRRSSNSNRKMNSNSNIINISKNRQSKVQFRESKTGDNNSISKSPIKQKHIKIKNKTILKKKAIASLMSSSYDESYITDKSNESRFKRKSFNIDCFRKNMNLDHSITHNIKENLCRRTSLFQPQIKEFLRKLSYNKPIKRHHSIKRSFKSNNNLIYRLKLHRKLINSTLTVLKGGQINSKMKRFRNTSDSYSTYSYASNFEFNSKNNITQIENNSKETNNSPYLPLNKDIKSNNFNNYNNNSLCEFSSRDESSTEKENNETIVYLPSNNQLISNFKDYRDEIKLMSFKQFSSSKNNDFTMRSKNKAKLLSSFKEEQNKFSNNDIETKITQIFDSDSDLNKSLQNEVLDMKKRRNNKANTHNTHTAQGFMNIQSNQVTSTPNKFVNIIEETDESNKYNSNTLTKHDFNDNNKILIKNNERESISNILTDKIIITDLDEHIPVKKSYVDNFKNSPVINLNPNNLSLTHLANNIQSNLNTDTKSLTILSSKLLRNKTSKNSCAKTKFQSKQNILSPKSKLSSPQNNDIVNQIDDSSNNFNYNKQFSFKHSNVISNKIKKNENSINDISKSIDNKSNEINISNSKINSDVKQICVDDNKDIIVICDDSDTILDSLQKLLLSIPEVKEKYSIMRITDGAYLVSCIIYDQVFQRVKVVITDENMEFINGSQAINILKKAEVEGKISTNRIYISLTAFEDDDMKKYLLSTGFHRILAKPTSKQSIIECFKSIKII